ncbi:hypothetical protein [Clostridium tertium]|uniref:Molybdenum cofactor biosynthesis protein A n=1 Tax=Clostridium tertium TaxID=1559 RepID=A0A6N3ESZ6_9CLOT
MIKSYPIVHFEICGKCNGKCPYCVTGKRNQTLGSFVNPELFNKTLEEIIRVGIFDKDISTLYIYNWGEPFLHPQFNEIIEKINLNNINYGISTNLSIIPKNIDFSIVAKNLKVFMISMPGFSQKSYDKIHGFDFQKIKSNILDIKAHLYRNDFRGKLQILFHIYQFNLDEIYDAERFAKSLGIEFIPYYAGINDWWQRESYLNNAMDKESIKKISNDIFLSKLDERIKKSKNKGCSQHNSYFMIDENCNVATCCCLPNNHPNYKCGNILEDNIEEILYNKFNQDVCCKCIEQGLAIDDEQVSLPKWFYNSRRSKDYNIESNNYLEDFIKGNINEYYEVAKMASELVSNYITEDDLIRIFKLNTFDDLYLLTRLASEFFERKLYKLCIITLEYALRLDIFNENTLYNLGYVFYIIGKYQDSIYYLNKIKEKDDDTDILLENIYKIQNAHK